jgi:colicin import membrane protein
MTAYAYETPNEKAVSGALALVMHLMFFALLVFGVSWQKREAPPLVAELWSSLPAPKAAPPPPKAEPKPVPKAEPKPPPPPKVEPKPKPEPKPVPKADISVQEKKEKERKARELELAEKKKREERELAEKKKKEEQAQLAALKRQQEKERAEQIAREQDEALKKIAQAEAQARVVDEYKRQIADRIRRFIIEPPGLQGNPEVEFNVVVIPGGEVLNVKLRRASGQVLWDSAVERAIRRAQPLPLPPVESGLMREFRELNLKFRPKE